MRAKTAILVVFIFLTCFFGYKIFGTLKGQLGTQQDSFQKAMERSPDLAKFFAE